MGVRAIISLLSAGGLLLACGGGDDPVEPGTPLEDVGNQAPIIDSVRLTPAEPADGDVVRAIVRARDPEGARLELRYRWSVAGRRVDEDGAALALQGVDRGSFVEVEVTAHDGVAASEPVEARTAVRNQRPRLLEVRTEPWDTVERGTPVLLTPRGEDPDRDGLSYEVQWHVNGEPVAARDTSLATESLAVGDVVQARVVASDGSARSDPVDSPRVRVVNAHPRILSEPDGLSEDGTFRYTVQATDPDGDGGLRFWLRTAPDGMRIDPSSGQIVWRPRVAQRGRHTVEVEVRDREGATTVQHFELDVASDASPS
jgi:hypothetical protein